MSKLVRHSRRIAVALIGFPLFLVGLVLIPLPGPGLIVCFAAFFILSLEFSWAEKRFEQAKQAIRKIYDESKARAERIEQWGEEKDTRNKK